MPLIRLRYLSMNFLALSTLFRCQGGKPLTNNPLDDPFLKTLDPLVPRYLGDPLFIESAVSYQWPMLDLPLLVIGASLFIFVPGF